MVVPLFLDPCVLGFPGVPGGFGSPQVALSKAWAGLSNTFNNPDGFCKPILTPYLLLDVTGGPSNKYPAFPQVTTYRDEIMVP